jgi:DNA-binding transcriptional LysR family regulator
MAVFLRVADAGSFTAAADALGITVSAVTECLSGLEERLGTRLVRRTTRAIALTDAGRAFDERCRRILREVREAERAVKLAGERPRLRAVAARQISESDSPKRLEP